MENQWHYKDEKTGKRLGPVGRDDIERLIADNRVDRASLVWNPAMPDWARLSTTELVALFGDQPPPMPASEINRWAVYVMALVPLWGVFVEAVASYYLSERVHLTPSAMFDHRAWLFFYVIANGIFGSVDERNLEKAGLKIRGAAVLSAILAPVYIFVSCRTIARHAERRAWSTYTPFLLWFAALAGSVFVDASVQDLLA